MYYYRIISIIIFTVGITLSLTPSIYAADPISISTSQNLYNSGDTVVVFGEITQPLPGLPNHPKKKPTSCHIASRPRHPGITGSSLK